MEFLIFQLSDLRIIFLRTFFVHFKKAKIKRRPKINIISNAFRNVCELKCAPSIAHVPNNFQRTKTKKWYFFSLSISIWTNVINWETKNHTLSIIAYGAPSQITVTFASCTNIVQDVLGRRSHMRSLQSHKFTKIMCFG